MKKIIALCFVLLGCQSSIQMPAHSNPPIYGTIKQSVANPSTNDLKDSQCAYWSVKFSPNGGGLAQIVETIDAAKKSIYVQSYSFTSEPIAQALVNAKNRGVKVFMLLDKSNRNGNGTMYPMLLSNNMDFLFDQKHAIAHNKIMIIDESVVLTGSFNFTNSAESRNAENLIKLTNSELALVYLENWKKHKEHSVK